jgi:hypothetical protein
MAHRVIPRRRSNSVAVGGIADLVRRTAPTEVGALDPKLSWGRAPIFNFADFPEVPTLARSSSAHAVRFMHGAYRMWSALWAEARALRLARRPARRQS